MRVPATAVLLAATAASAGITPRDYNSLNGIIIKLNTDITTVTTNANAWPSDPNPPEALYNSAVQLIDDIHDSIPIGQASNQLSLPDTLRILSPVRDLNTKATGLRNAFQPLRTRFGHDNVCDIIRGLFEDLYNDGNTLIDVLVTKAATVAQSQAQAQADQFKATLNGAKDDFSSTNCVDAIDVNN